MFHAFISYSHRADAGLAAVLQRALERLGTPWWKRAPVRVFRDDATLTASAALWPSIVAGLETSEFFVLLASPAAATSVWVDREVRWWLQHRRSERLLIVVTAGNIVYEHTAEDFDWSVTDCLPLVLRSVFPSEPLWVDMRFVAKMRPLGHSSLRHARLRSAALTLVGAVRGIDKDELDSEDLRVHRRSIAAAAGAVGLIFMLGLATFAAVLLARSESASARANRLEADSRRLAAEALVDLARGGPGIEDAVLKAALAWRLSPTEDSSAALKRINDSTAAVAHVLGRHTSGAYKVSLSPDGRVLATAGREGAVLRWDVASGTSVGVGFAGRGWPDRLIHSNDGSHLLMLTHVRRDDGEHKLLWLFRLSDGATLALGDAWSASLAMLRPNRRRSGTLCPALSADGALIAIAEENTLLVLRVDDQLLVEHRLPGHLRVAALGFTPQGALVLMVRSSDGKGGHAARLDEPLRSSSTIRIGPRNGTAGTDCRFASVSGDGRRIAGVGGAWEIADGLQLIPIKLPARATSLFELTGHHAPELDARGRLMALGIGGTGFLWNLETRELVFQLPKQNNSHGPPLTLSADGRRLAGLQDGIPVVWALDNGGKKEVMSELDCGQREGLTERCITRLCEKLTVRTDAQRWTTLLGEARHDLIERAQALSCGADR